MTGPVVCFGEMLVRFSSPAGRLMADAQALEMIVGGAEANVSVALSALGWPTRMITALPTNPLGERARTALASAGVGTEFIVQEPGRMGIYFLEPGASLRPSSITYDRANSVFATALLEAFDFADALKGARLLHFSGITAALGQNGLAMSKAAMAAAKAAGVPISFDPNYRETLWNAWDSKPRESLLALVAEADILFAGHRDLTLLLDRNFMAEGAERRREAAEAAFVAFPKLQIMASTARQAVSQTHHRLAARVDTRDERHQTDEIDVTDIVDRVGSGDAFAAGVLHAWLNGANARTMATMGLALGALKHGLYGDFCQVGRAELESFTGYSGDIKR